MRTMIAICLLVLLHLTAAVLPTWTAGSGWLCKCEKVTGVFGVPVCVTSQSWTDSQAKCNHVVNILAQLLDNDGDGQADDPELVAHLVEKDYFLYVAATQVDAEENDLRPQAGIPKLIALWLTVQNSCDTPVNRGASDRASWPAHTESTSSASGKACAPERDVSTEGVLLLIIEAASQLWPATWGTSTYSGSLAGKATESANGDCGWGHSSDYTNPGVTGGCTGLYAYDDVSCSISCTITRGVHWAVLTYIGGLYTTSRAKGMANEWLMCTPDDAMQPIGIGGSTKAVSMQSGAPAFTDLVNDSSRVGHMWIPRRMPDGNYTGSAKAELPDIDGTCNVLSMDAIRTAIAVAGAMLVGVPIFCCIIPLMCSSTSSKSRKKNRTRIRPPNVMGPVPVHQEYKLNSAQSAPQHEGALDPQTSQNADELIDEQTAAEEGDALPITRAKIPPVELCTAASSFDKEEQVITEAAEHQGLV